MILTILKGIFVVAWAIPLSLVALFSIPVEPSGRLFHWSSRTWSKIILWTFGIKVSVKGLEHIEGRGHSIYVANHASWFDIPAVVAGIPDQIRIVFKKELTLVPIWGWALKYGHYIPIDRSNPKDAMKSLDEAAERIRNGASVLLFAEGTRTRDGKLQPFKRGAFALAAKSGVPIVPVTINHSYRILPKGALRVQATDIEIVLEKPIPTEGIDGKEGERILMNKVHDAIAEHFIEP